MTDLQSFRSEVRRRLERELGFHGLSGYDAECIADAVLTEAAAHFPAYMAEFSVAREALDEVTEEEP